MYTVEVLQYGTAYHVMSPQCWWDAVRNACELNVLHSHANWYYRVRRSAPGEGRP